MSSAHRSDDEATSHDNSSCSSCVAPTELRCACAQPAPKDISIANSRGAAESCSKMQVQFLVETQTVSAEHGTDESHEGDVQCAMDLTSVSFIRGDSSQGVERAAPFSTAPSARLQCRPIRAATNPPSCLLLYLRSPFQREAQGQELPRFHALPARRRSSSPKDEDE